MFFSRDLLNRKNALGIVWMISNGIKVAKNKVQNISVARIW
jgi:hypothetical protein